METGKIVWRPTPELIAASNLQHFMNRHGLRSLAELQQRSTTDIAWFWDAVLKQLDIHFDRPYERIVDLSRGIQSPQWCIGGELNIVESCLRDRAKIAVRYENEAGEMRTLSYAELRRVAIGG